MTITASLTHRVAVAPMLDWTDRHCRFLLRLLSRHTRLYSEMVTTGAILHGDRQQHLAYHDSEHPLALQLGGSDPAALAECAHIGADYGYDEINLNVGCPSDRVQSGRFGACLMAEPQRVADCIAAMQQAVSLPVTVKSRIGIDNMDAYEDLCRFVETVSQAGCGVFIIHARKAFLQGLSPKENRTVPPLRYDRVWQLKLDYPALEIVINGGITSLDEVASQLQHVDGAMLGRAVYHDPLLLADVDRRFFGDRHTVPTRRELVLEMLPYIETELNRGTQLKHITRHMLGLFQGQPGARRWRRHLSEHACRSGADSRVAIEALARIEDPDQQADPGRISEYG
ncbi:MAG: tRNA dihydrouridine(20/20a) synthase DusA [Gammaproteobacteria bacterium]